MEEVLLYRCVFPNMPSIKWGCHIWLFLSAAGKEAPVVTPLMMYVRQQRAAKNMAQVHLFLN